MYPRSRKQSNCGLGHGRQPQAVAVVEVVEVVADANCQQYLKPVCTYTPVQLRTRSKRGGTHFVQIGMTHEIFFDTILLQGSHTPAYRLQSQLAGSRFMQYQLPDLRRYHQQFMQPHSAAVAGIAAVVTTVSLVDEGGFSMGLGPLIHHPGRFQFGLMTVLFGERVDLLAGGGTTRSTFGAKLTHQPLREHA